MIRAALTLTFAALIALGIGHTILTAALTLPETLTQAATLKGM